MTNTAVMTVSACVTPPSSSSISAKTIDASPRGPNQPMKPTVGRRMPLPASAAATGAIRISVRLSSA